MGEKKPGAEAEGSGICIRNAAGRRRRKGWEKERKGDVLRERFLSIGGQLASKVHITYTQFSHLKDTLEKCFKIVDKLNAKSTKSF